MSRILILYTTEVTTVGLLQNDFSLLLYGTNVHTVFRKIENLTYDELNAADSVLFVRETSLSVFYIARIVRKSHIFMGVFFDDDMLFPSKFVSSMPWVRFFSRKCVEMADYVLSGNPHLAKKYACISWQKRSCVMHTPIRSELIRQIPENKLTSVVKIVYAAGPAHHVLFSKYIKPVLHKLDERYGNRISLTFVGVRPELDIRDYSFEITYQPAMPLEEYRRFMREQCFAIGLAPLHVDEFSSCKYFNKFIEYTLVGTVGIYTRCKPYTYVVKDGTNGFLADNTKRGWFEKICEAVDDEKKRSDCLKNAVRYLETEHNIRRIQKKLLADIPELEAVREKDVLCKKPVFLKYLLAIDKVLSLLFYSFWEVRHEGMGWMIRRLKFHLSKGRVQENINILLNKIGEAKDE